MFVYLKRMKNEKNMRHTEYYIQAFKRLEEHKHAFNWPAAIFGSCWMAYKKMYLYVFIYYYVNCLAAFVIGFVFGFINGWFCLDFSIKAIAYFTVCLWLIISCPLFGRFGNVLYARIVKHRISKGYHLIDRYTSTSVLSSFWPFFYLFAAAADWVLHKRYFKKRALNEADAAYSEENIRRYLDKLAINWLAIEIWTVLFIVAVFCHVLAVT